MLTLPARTVLAMLVHATDAIPRNTVANKLTEINQSTRTLDDMTTMGLIMQFGDELCITEDGMNMIELEARTVGLTRTDPVWLQARMGLLLDRCERADRKRKTLSDIIISDSQQ